MQVRKYIRDMFFFYIFIWIPKNMASTRFLVLSTQFLKLKLKILRKYKYALWSHRVNSNMIGCRLDNRPLCKFRIVEVLKTTFQHQKKLLRRVWDVSTIQPYNTIFLELNFLRTESLVFMNSKPENKMKFKLDKHYL